MRNKEQPKKLSKPSEQQSKTMQNNKKTNAL